MKEIISNIWALHSKGWIVIPTNGMTKKDGTAVMGAGLAKQAASRFPELPEMLGRGLSRTGNHVRIFPHQKLIIFPTKNHWKDEASLELIERSAWSMVQEMKHFGYSEEPVYLPRVGCGLGKLKWPDVKKILAKYLPDNYHVVTQTREDILW